jgi:hypothetical protein
MYNTKFTMIHDVDRSLPFFSKMPENLTNVGTRKETATKSPYEDFRQVLLHSVYKESKEIPTYSNKRNNSVKLLRKKFKHTTNTVLTVAALTFVDSSYIPIDSPIHKFQFLKRGWDGYWAYPFSQQALIRAHKFWNDLIKKIKDKSNFPIVTAGSNGSIAFTWTNCTPHKELEIWIFDQLDYYSEWLLIVNNSEEEGESFSKVDLLTLFQKYQIQQLLLFPNSH